MGSDGYRRATGKTQKQIPHDEAVRNDKNFGVMRRSKLRATVWGLPLGFELLESRRISAQPKRKTEIEKRS